MARLLKTIRPDELEVTRAVRAPMALMYEKQTTLMEAYRDAGKLSQWPLELHDPNNQEFYRALMNFLEIELIEGTVEYEDILESVSKNNVNEAELHVIYFNEEVADALHFWVELFIFAGIEADDLTNYFDKLGLEKGMNPINCDPFKALLAFGNSYSNKSEYLRAQHGEVFVINNKDEYYEKGGTRVSSGRLINYKAHMFECIKYLKLAQNELSNKYWKVGQAETNVYQFNNYLMEAWLNFGVCLAIAGFEKASLAMTYQAKNIINHERLNKK